MVGRSSVLDFDYASTEREILGFIRSVVKGAGARGVVVGLSGGIDSAVVGALCVRALGKGRVTALLMPSDFTPAADIDDATTLARMWGVKTLRVKISGIADSIYSSLPVEGTKISRANVHARVRMVLCYYVANARGLLVVGTGDKSEDEIGFFCFDSKTRVVTVDGPKSLDELKVGDRVFSLNPESRMMVETGVSSIFKFNYSGEMVHFKGRGTDLMVTPNHRMLTQTSSSNPNSKPIYRTAEECMKLKNTIVPMPVNWAGESSISTTVELRFRQRHIPRIVQLSIEDVLYLVGLFIGDGCATAGKVAVAVKSNLSQRAYASTQRDGRGQFMSLPAKLNEVHMKEYETFETTFTLPEYTKVGARRKLISVLTKYGIGYSLTRDTVRIPSKGIHDFFAQCGKGARHKRIPRWVLSFPSEYLVHLLRGLKDSDGSHAEDQNVFYTSSEHLKNDFVQLCFKLGRRATVRLRGSRRPTINGKTIRTGPSYEICFAGKPHSQHSLAGRLAKRVDYVGLVWCPSVPPFENILVERHGRYIFSGNTKYGDGGVDFLPIAHLYKTQVRALGARLGIPKRIVNKPASPQLWPGHRAADELPADYRTLDPLLYYLFDERLPPSAAARKAGASKRILEGVLKMHESSAHKRATPPTIRPL